MDDEHRTPSEPSTPDAGGTYGQQDQSGASRRSAFRTDQSTEAAGPRPAANSRARRGEDELAGSDALGGEEGDVGRGAD